MKWQEAISSEYLNLMKEQTLFETTTVFIFFSLLYKFYE